MKLRSPYPGRNLGRFTENETTYTVRCVRGVLHFRPLYGREADVVKIPLADVLGLLSSASSVFMVAGEPFSAWVKEGEVRFRRLGPESNGTLSIPLTAAMDLAKKQLFIPTGGA